MYRHMKYKLARLIVGSYAALSKLIKDMMSDPVKSQCVARYRHRKLPYLGLKLDLNAPDNRWARVAQTKNLEDYGDLRKLFLVVCG